MAKTGPTKPHPGCTPPTMPGIPDISTALTNMGTALAKKLIPTTIAVKVGEAQDRITVETAAAKAAVAERAATLKKMANNPCPLPRVADKAAKPS